MRVSQNLTEPCHDGCTSASKREKAGTQHGADSGVVESRRERCVLNRTPGLRIDGPARHYVIVGRDGCELHFYACDNPLTAQNTSCYVRTSSTQAPYLEFKGRGADIKPPEDRPWGMKELYVIDPLGNLLKFGELG